MPCSRIAALPPAVRGESVKRRKMLLSCPGQTRDFRNGSGTIFFSNCNLRCVFCQNWPISHEGKGKELQDDDLASMMIKLQKIGCHNINVVTPTHVMPNILNVKVCS